MTEDEFNDYMRGAAGIQTGGAYNQLGYSDYQASRDAAKQSSIYIPQGTSQRVTNSRSLNESYTFVDDWFEKLPGWVNGLLIAVGIVAGLVTGLFIDVSGWELLGIAALGALAGMALIPMLIYSIKITIVLSILVLFFGGLYWLFEFLTKHI
jgi:hypothetical protein